MLPYADLAQLVEHMPEEHSVLGSTPRVRTIYSRLLMVGNWSYKPEVPDQRVIPVQIWAGVPDINAKYHNR